ncbi:alpha/beta-Hydrolases superfamily protein [Striga hermonthica]|uniref:Alpha/beta-Hydrolases superfamily protein n=1 Tax=Striga hermonthica TaxID=68872 RepID=A0A9N7RD92_STRHE|nr:alpha/beta-Hydrolases superfamily protein [Striga hermonthica]
MGASCLSIVPLLKAFLRRSATAAGLTSQAAAIDGDTTIHFWGPPPAAAAASSKPKLVLIHGFGPAGIWQWRDQISFFAGEFDVYVPDLVFFGGSSTESASRCEIFQATCLAKLLEKLGVRRYSLVGTSYGGFVAYHMAAMWPERVEKVVIASSAVNLRRHDNDELLRKAKSDKIEDLLMPVTTGQLRTLLRLVIFRRVYLPDFILNDFLHNLFCENRKEKLELLQGLTIGQDDTLNISPLSQEVLIVWGERDQIFLLEKAVELNKLLGENARLQVIQRASHAPQLEQPGRFNNIVKDFLNGQMQ